MYLLRSWKESFVIFFPQNFKKFLLVTLKNAQEVYLNLFRSFWWIILGLIALKLRAYYSAFQDFERQQTLWNALELSIYIMLSFALFMLVRPSVQLKRYAYFKQQVKKVFVGFITLYFSFAFIRRFVVGKSMLYLITALDKTSTVGSIILPIATFIYDEAPFIMLPPFVFTVLFYFDRNGMLKYWFLAIVRGIGMFIYNFPFCLISVIFCFGIWKSIEVLLPEHGQWVFFSFIPFVVSYFRTMYVKRLHDQFSLYFPYE